MSDTYLKISLSLFIFLFAGFDRFAFQATQQKKEPKPKYNKISSHVIVVTINGLKADDIVRSEALRSRIPTLLSLRSKGAYAVEVESVYPSLSRPAHATIATGTLPSDHGVTYDFPFDEKTGIRSSSPFTEAKDIKTDAIWDAVKRAKLSTAAIGFPLTSGASIDFIPPTTSGNSPMMANDKLKEIAADQQIDQLKAVSAVGIIEAHRPNLLLINFESYEKAQAEYGPLSTEALLAIESVDGFVRLISGAVDRAGMTSEASFIVVSDCGMMKIENEFKPNAVLEKKKFLEADGQGRITSWRAMAVSFGGSAAIFLKNPQDEKAAQELEKIFREYHERPDSPIWRIVTRREAAQLGADPRPVFYIDAAPGFAFASRVGGSSTSKAAKESGRAARGFLPSRSEARATLIMAGKGIKPGGRVEYARLIDIAPTIARLLGLEMRTARGRVLSEAITNEEINTQRN